MIIDFFRIIAILLLIIIIVLDDISIYNKALVNKSLQFTIAFIIIVIINIDTTFGFVLALCTLVIYYKTYIKLIQKNNQEEALLSYENKPIVKNSELADETDIGNTKIINNNTPPKDGYKYASYKAIEKKDDILNYPLKTKYISDEHLFAAQNNIVDFKSYNQEIKGMNCNGFNSKKIYSAQGLDSDNVNYTGYEESNNKYSNF